MTKKFLHVLVPPALTMLTLIFWDRQSAFAGFCLSALLAWALYDAWEILRTRRIVREAGITLVNELCAGTTDMHHEHDGTCCACGPEMQWPCPTYLSAMTVSTDTDKAKLKFLRSNMNPVIMMITARRSEDDET